MLAYEVIGYIVMPLSILSPNSGSFIFVSLCNKVNACGTDPKLENRRRKIIANIRVSLASLTIPCFLRSSQILVHMESAALTALWHFVSSIIQGH